MPTKDAITRAEYYGEYMVSGDKMFRRVYNAESAAMEYGFPVCYEAGESEQVINPITAVLNGFAGVVANSDDYDDTTYTIPALSYGTIIIHGECAGVYVDGSGTEITAGLSMKCEDGTNEMLSDATGAGDESSYSSMVVALEGSTTSATLIKGFVRARG